jgi:hypothetical protein
LALIGDERALMLAGFDMGTEGSKVRCRSFSKLRNEHLLGDTNPEQLRISRINAQKSLPGYNLRQKHDCVVAFDRSRPAIFPRAM